MKTVILVLVVLLHAVQLFATSVAYGAIEDVPFPIPSGYKFLSEEEKDTFLGANVRYCIKTTTGKFIHDIPGMIPVSENLGSKLERLIDHLLFYQESVVWPIEVIEENEIRYVNNMPWSWISGRTLWKGSPHKFIIIGKTSCSGIDLIKGLAPLPEANTMANEMNTIMEELSGSTSNTSQENDRNRKTKAKAISKI